MAVRRARKTDGENILEYQYVLCEVKAVGVRANTAKYWKQWNDYKKSSACKFERGKCTNTLLAKKGGSLPHFYYQSSLFGQCSKQIYSIPFLAGMFLSCHLELKRTVMHCKNQNCSFWTIKVPYILHRRHFNQKRKLIIDRHVMPKNPIINQLSSFYD